MNTEEVNDYLKKLKDNAATKEPITPTETDSKPETPSEIVESVDDNNKGVEQKPVEETPDDKGEEPKAEVNKDETNSDPKPEDEVKPVETETKEQPKKVSQRDYAFERLKRKSREQHEKDLARIKELEEELAKGKGLKAEHFIDKDGKPDPNSYVDWKFKERSMQDEIKQIQQADFERQRQEDIEEDRRRVENCYQDEKERKEYEELIQRNGKAFYDAVSEVDPNGVVFKYLSTMPEYPIVLKELMTDNKLLGYTFRSTDPDALKHNIIMVADQILDRHHNQISTPKAVKPEVVAQKQETTKKELPVMGKQINSSPGSTVNVVKDRNYWNNYLKEHPRG
jgi:hypothetical protein